MPSINNFSPNTLAESAKVNENFTNVTGVLKPTFYVSVPSTLFIGSNQTPIIIVPQSMTIIKISAVVKTAPTGSTIILDINKNGSTIWSTQANRLTIADGSTSGSTTSINTTSLVEGDLLTVDLDQVGSNVSGADLTVSIRCAV